MTLRNAAAAAAILLVLCVACGGGPGASPSALASVSPSSEATEPAPSQTPEVSLAPLETPEATPVAEPRPLPEGYTRIPKGRETFLYEPKSKPDTLVVGEPHNFRLEHCGLGSPVDIDGSVWDPKYGQDGTGGPLTDDQLSDLDNEGRVTLLLTDEDTLQMTTRHAAIITLIRHDGARRYLPCA
jgi:hypothetical protein